MHTNFIIYLPAQSFIHSILLINCNLQIKNITLINVVSFYMGNITEIQLVPFIVIVK